MTIISCPGKVLLFGGYICLDQRFSALVLAVTARFQCEIQDSDTNISVHSQQFQNSDSNYKWQNNQLICTLGDNKFIDIVMATVFEYIYSKGIAIRNIQIIINGDNDFYSQLDYLKSIGQSANINNLLEIPRFNQQSCEIKKAHKTGLGSSAALVTSMVAAILLHFKVIENLNEESVNLICKLSHISHCAAQGKIGSGFDVSSACFGNHEYKRFSPNLLEQKRPVQDIIHDLWDYKVSPFELPDGFHLQLGEIKTGSNTPKMVQKVLEWRAINLQESMGLFNKGESIWIKLQELQTAIKNKFLRFQQLAKSIDLQQELAKIERLVISKLDPSTELEILVKQTFAENQEYRKLMKRMGVLAGVEIEPDEQSHLLEMCLSVPGVMVAGVPGGIP